MTVEGAKLDAIQYSVQYELIRSQIIGIVSSVNQGNTAGQTRGIGLALLLSEGMPGWLMNVASVLRASLASRTVDSPGPSPHEAVARYSSAPVSGSGTGTRNCGRSL
jgi:hypothetical protein